MSSVPQVPAQEISDADLDNVSGGVFAAAAGEFSVVPSLSAGISGAVGVDVLDIAGLGSTATLSA